ncbi:hypothetical protein [Cohnella sp. REN36]|uniref:TlpA family protein disulfide reductase n=1 Tax=Cohnella sp. REN36 TaxID=2887347 RepID=UPI001D1373A3|nr:hypothetical protein [Cohnella sp. REN36]MCC3374575.1 hypothetical protein [Cohnella sp. REN36]
MSQPNMAAKDGMAGFASIGLKPGDLLPPMPGAEIPTASAAGDGRTALVFASLHCLDCIDLLPHLAAAARGMPEYTLALFTTGDETDNREMQRYFGWAFPVYSMAQGEMGRRYAISALPCAILTDERGRLAASGAVHDAAELLALRASVRLKGGDSDGMRMSDGDVF